MKHQWIKTIYSTYLLVLVTVIIQFLFYLIYYKSIGEIGKVLWYSEIVYFSKFKPDIVGECSAQFSQLVFPDPLIYSYVASVIVINYLRRANYRIVPSRITLIIYILVMISELIESSIAMAPFRGNPPGSIPLHITWMLDDFIVFLILFRVLELWIGLIRRPWALIESPRRKVSALFNSWLTIMFGWMIPWLFYASLFYYAISPYCNVLNMLWISNLQSLAEYGFPLALVFTGLMTGMFYGVYRLVKNTYPEPAESEDVGESITGTLLSSFTSFSIITSGVKTLIAKIIVLINTNALDLVIGFADLVYRPHGVSGLVLFYMSLVSYWFTTMWFGLEVMIRKHGSLKLKYKTVKI